MQDISPKIGIPSNFCLNPCLIHVTIPEFGGGEEFHQMPNQWKLANVKTIDKKKNKTKN